MLGDHAHGMGQLQRRGQKITLTDAGAEGVASKPAVLVVAALPLLRRQQSALFARQVDPGRLAKAETAEKLVDAIDAQAQRGIS
jgi:hypothetical protein